MKMLNDFLIQAMEARECNVVIAYPRPLNWFAQDAGLYVWAGGSFAHMHILL